MTDPIKADDDDGAKEPIEENEEEYKGPEKPFVKNTPELPTIKDDEPAAAKGISAVPIEDSQYKDVDVSKWNKKEKDDSPPTEAVQPFDAQFECEKLLAQMEVLDSNATNDRFVFGELKGSVETLDAKSLDIDKTLSDRITEINANNGETARSLESLRAFVKEEATRFGNQLSTILATHTLILGRIEFLEQELRPDQLRRLDQKKKIAKGEAVEVARAHELPQDPGKSLNPQNPYGGSKVSHDKSRATRNHNGPQTADFPRNKDGSPKYPESAVQQKPQDPPGMNRPMKND